MRGKKGIVVGILGMMLLALFTVFIYINIGNQAPENYGKVSDAVEELNSNDIQLSDESIIDKEYSDKNTKIALDSLNLLKDAIDALASKRTISKDTIATEEEIIVTIYGNFEGKKPRSNSKKSFDDLCSTTVTKYGKHKFNCDDNYDSIYYLNDYDPYDVNKVTDMKVKVKKDGKIIHFCDSGANSWDDHFKGEDLTTSKEGANDCEGTAPNFIICGNHIVRYCGKAGWILTVDVKENKNYGKEKDKDGNIIYTDSFKNGYYGIHSRDEGKWLSDKWSAGVNILKKATGFAVEGKSYVTCDDGRIVGEGENQKCLRCDPVDNNNKGKCSLVGFELPQTISKIKSESWLQGVGDPDFMVYSEVFPKGTSDSWYISKVSPLSVGISGGTNRLNFMPFTKINDVSSKIFTKSLVEKIAKSKLSSNDESDKSFKSIATSISKSVKDNIVDFAVQNNYDNIFDRSVSETSLNVINNEKEIATKLVKNIFKNVCNEINKDLKLDISSALVDDIFKNIDVVSQIDVLGKFSNAESLTSQIMDSYDEKIRSKVKMHNIFSKVTSAEKITDDQLNSNSKKIRSTFVKIISSPNIDMRRITKEIEISNTLGNSDEFFRSNVRNILIPKNGDYTSNVDRKKFEDISKEVNNIISNLDEEPFVNLMKKSEYLMNSFIVDGDINWKKINPDFSNEFIEVMNNDITNLIYKNNNPVVMEKISRKLDIFIKKRTPATVFGGVMAIYSARMDTSNSKYTPAGYNTLSLAQTSSFENRRLFPLSEAAKNFFIRLDKEGRDHVFTDRFFLASPCKTDLDIRVETCKCNVENVVTGSGDAWNGFLLETENGVVPVRNIKSGSQFKMKSFAKKGSKLDKFEKYIKTQSVGEIKIIDHLAEKVEFPVIKNLDGNNYAVKECSTRDYFDRVFTTTNNIDSETLCINIAEANTGGFASQNQYRDYNGGNNFCYAGYNKMGAFIKSTVGVLEAAVIGATIYFSGGVALLVAPAAIIGGTYSQKLVDSTSRWPSRSFKFDNLGDAFSNDVNKLGNKFVDGLEEKAGKISD